MQSEGRSRTPPCPRRGIKDQQLVWVSSRRGKVITRAAIDERINKGAVYMTYQ